MPAPGFRVAIDDLRDAVKGPLPDLHDTLWDALFEAGGFTPHPGPVGADDAGLGRVMNAFGAALDAFGDRQREGAEAIEATREALRAVITVYARVDGQE